MIYDIIKTLRPYFYSLREVNDKVALDMKFQSSWRFEDSQSEELEIKVQDKNDDMQLVSIIAPATKDGYSDIFEFVHHVIKFNEEQEEKRRLLQEKMDELKSLFEIESLDNLKELKFNGKNERKNSTSDGMVGEGNEEGSEGNTGQ